MPRPLIVSVIAVAALLTVLLRAQGSAETPLRPNDPASDTHRTRTMTARPSGTLIFMAGANRLVSIDVATGHRTARAIRSMASCAPELFVTAGRVVFAGVRNGRTTVFSVPTTLDRRPTRLGAAHIFVRSATEGRVWLAGTDCSQSGMVGAREVTVDGRVTVETHRRVPGDWVDVAVDRGLVIVRHRASVIWSPSTGRISRPGPLESVSAARGPLLAGCTERCHDLVVFNTRTAKATVARTTDRPRLDFGVEFSPDRSVLAAAAYAHRRYRLALVDTGTGATRLIPGSQTGSPSPSWASTGWLYFVGQRRQIKAYRAGAPRPVTLPFRAPRKAVAFAAG